MREDVPMSAIGVEQAANAVLPLGSTDPQAVVAAGRAVAELVRRLTHATLHRAAFTYPSELDLLVGSLTAAVHGLEQTFGQLAARLDVWGSEGRVGHDELGAAAASVACAQAAAALRRAAGSRAAVTEPLEQAGRLTSHLTYTD